MSIDCCRYHKYHLCTQSKGKGSIRISAKWKYDIKGRRTPPCWLATVGPTDVTMLLPILGDHLSQWFPNFFSSRTIWGIHTFTTYHLTPGKLNLTNIMQSKLGKPELTHMPGLPCRIPEGRSWTFYLAPELESKIRRWSRSSS